MSKYTKELLEPIVKESISMREVLRKLGLKTSGGNNTNIKNIVTKYNISTEHFLGQGHMKGKSPVTKRTKEEFIKDILCLNGVGWISHGIKLKLYEFNLKEEKCEKCGLGNEWQGEIISLHLDHINGNSTDNRLENLRILCPNCHSQTKTYAGKRLKVDKEIKVIKEKEKYDNHCIECNCLIDRKANRCKSCETTKRNKEKRNFTLPSKETLLKLLRETNFTKVGKKYGVTDNAVRKWCKKYDLPTKSSFYK